MNSDLILRESAIPEITKGVIQKKLAKQRHLVIPRCIHSTYLDNLFPQILENFYPQTVVYNGGIENVKEWKSSCYLEVMEGGIPCTNPCENLRERCEPLLKTCNDVFKIWYKQQHACNGKIGDDIHVHRLMTFITRYTKIPGDQAGLMKHVDGAGKVDGSLVVALPIDRWSGPEEKYSFEGFGGGLTFWDGKDSSGKPVEIKYDTRSGDIAFIDKAVWHQANPITRGTRWALVIFYKVVSSTLCESDTVATRLGRIDS